MSTVKPDNFAIEAIKSNKLLAEIEVLAEPKYW